jgi:hypothetical protein
MSRTIHLSNGIILIDHRSANTAHSITITDGRVVGHDLHTPDDALQIDLQGKFAVPAFIDSHMHLVLSATGRGEVDLKQCESQEQFQEDLLHGHTLLEAGQWLVCSGMSDALFDAAPNKNWVPDEIDIPVICYRNDFHTALVNDVLLKHLDCALIRTMPGGNTLDEGIVKEDALFDCVNPLIPQSSIETQIHRTKRAVQELHAQGITCVGSMEHLKDINSVLAHIQEEQCIRMRIMCLDEPTVELMQQCNETIQDDFLEITGFKSFLDGTLGSRSAKMYSDWNDVAGSGVWAGHASKGTLQEWVLKVSRAGFAPVLHAIGDEAVGCALRAIEQVDSSLVPRIEHAQCISDIDLPNVNGKWFGVQPLHQPGDAVIAPMALGETRVNELHNWRRMLDAGANLSFGSDWPIAPPNPLESMAIAIQQGLSPVEALEASTINGAKSLRSSLAGHLHRGAYGDIAILDKNPLSTDWHNGIPSVTMTIQDGKIVYQKEKKHE